MLDATPSTWQTFFEHSNDNELEPQAQSSLAFITKKNVEWLEMLSLSLKGTTWEMEIVKCALNDVMDKIKKYASPLLNLS